MAFGAPNKDKLAIQSATGKTLYGSRLMVELLPNATYFGRMGGKQSRKEQPDNRQKTRKNLNDNTGKDKSPNNGIKLRGGLGPKR